MSNGVYRWWMLPLLKCAIVARRCKVPARHVQPLVDWAVRHGFYR